MLSWHCSTLAAERHNDTFGNLPPSPGDDPYPSCTEDAAEHPRPVVCSKLGPGEETVNHVRRYKVLSGRRNSVLDKRSLIISIYWMHEGPVFWAHKIWPILSSRLYTMAGRFLLWKGRGANHPLDPLPAWTKWTKPAWK